MKFSSLIAIRQLTSGRRSRFFSWIALLSIAGISISVAAMISVLSVIDGFETELRQRFLSANAHVLAFKYPIGMDDPENWAALMKADFREVTETSRFVHYETMATHGPLIHSVLVRGFVPSEREKVQSITNSIKPPQALDALELYSRGTNQNPPPAIVGVGVAKILGLKIGDVFTLVSPKGKDFSQTSDFELVGIYHAGLKHYDTRLIALGLQEAQSLFDLGNRVTGIEIAVTDPDRTPELAEEMSHKYSLTIKEWQSFNKGLFEAMKTEKTVIFLIVFLIAVVAGFNILTTLFVAVTQKQKDISILKAIGATNAQIIQIFLKQGAMFGLIGVILGMVLALGIGALIERYQFIDLPDPYFLTSLPVSYSPTVYGSIAILGSLICLFASVIPSMNAAKTNPVEGLRGTGKSIND